MAPSQPSDREEDGRNHNRQDRRQPLDYGEVWQRCGQVMDAFRETRQEAKDDGIFRKIEGQVGDREEKEKAFRETCEAEGSMRPQREGKQEVEQREREHDVNGHVPE
jgi:hypothetical protein